MKQVSVAFYATLNGKLSFADRLVSWWTKPRNSSTSKTFTHVELRFGSQSTTSITQREGVVHYEESKLLQSKNYASFLTVQVEPQQYRDMQQMAVSFCENKVAFNTRGMVCNFLPLLRCCFASSGQDDAGFYEQVFCSQYVVLLLQEGGFVSWLDPAHTTPNDLYEALKRGQEGFREGFNAKLFKLMQESGHKLALPRGLG